MSGSNSLSIRLASPADAPDVRRLEILDETDLPSLAVLVAEVDGEMVAAFDPASGVVAANPFRRTAGVVDLMKARAAQLTGRRERPRRLRRLRIATGLQAAAA